MLGSELRIDIIERFTDLQKALAKLANSVCNLDKSLPIWFKSPELFKNKTSIAREQLASFIQQLEFVDEQNPKEILLGPGILACSSTTLELISNANIAKEKFKHAVLELKVQNIKLSDPFLTDKFNEILDKSRNKVVSNALNKMGLARIHLKQCYRKIPTLNQRPEKVSWTWANTKAIKKIDIATAREMLTNKKLDSGIEQQIRKLETLNPGDKLAIVQELAPHLRANILTNSKDNNNGKSRFMIKGSMPIFYLDSSKVPLPSYTYPEHEKKVTESSRKKRNDIKIESAPFIPALRAHRYLEECV